MNEQGNGEGWLVFAGILLTLAGVMRFFDAIWAFRYSGAVPDNLQNALLGHSLTTYGWVWLVISIILFGIGPCRDGAIAVRSLGRSHCSRGRVY